jgi:hypothetical protein
MTTLRPRYEPEASQTSAEHWNTGYIELDTINNLHNEAMNNGLSEPSEISLNGGKSTIATTQSAIATEASMPRQTSIYNSNIELEAINPHHDGVGAAGPEFSLPPVDGGKDAWLFLFSAFILEILVWSNVPLHPRLLHRTYKH